MRLIVALASALAAGLFAWFVVKPQLDAPPQPLAVVPRTPQDADTAAWRARMEAELPPIPIRAFEDTTLVRSVLAAPILERLYVQLRTGAMAWHPQIGFRRPANLDDHYDWDELPLGGWNLTTNSEGWRADAELDPTLPIFAIAGDSHAEGACDLADTFSGRIAAALAGEQLQVLNAACGGHSFHQYLGVLEALCGDVPGQLVDRDADQPLETFVVSIYGGNDLHEVLRLAHWFGKSDRPPGWGRDNARIAPWRKEHLPAIAQAVEGAVYFRNNPGEAQLALAEAVAVCEELVRHAERRGIRLLFLYLPSPLETEPDAHAAQFEELLAAMELDGASLATYFELGDQLLSRLTDLGGEIRDLRPAFRDSSVPLFWERDLHLNLDGHALVAAEVLDWYRAPDNE
ncbi:MAG: hypothetical protein P1V81_05435 [Planctomycetota bacterium]|nr:hypothetical protein [Planctomycetota bacterium]